MATRFCVTSVPRSAGDDAITLGGVSSYHPPSGVPMRAQEERRKRKKTTPPLNPLPREGRRLHIDSIPPPLDPLPGEGRRLRINSTTPPLNPLPREGKRLRKLYLCFMLFIKDIYLN